MEPFTATIYFVLGGIAAAVIILWPIIVDIIQQRIIPYVRRIMGNSVAEVLASFVCFLDRTITFVRRQAKKLLKYFQGVILKMDTTYIKLDENNMSATTQAYVNNSGKVSKLTIEEEIAYEDVPADIREKMISLNFKKTTSNDLEIINKRAEDLIMEMEY